MRRDRKEERVNERNVTMTVEWAVLTQASSSEAGLKKRE